MRGLRNMMTPAVITKVQPRKRQSRPRALKKKNQRPPSQMGRLSGSMVNDSWPRKPSGAQSPVAPAAPDVLLKPEEREVVDDVPNQIGQKDQEGDCAADPEPA